MGTSVMRGGVPVMREPFRNGRDLLQRSQYEYRGRGTRMAPVPQPRVTLTLNCFIDSTSDERSLSPTTNRPGHAVIPESSLSIGMSEAPPPYLGTSRANKTCSLG
jgi:hypothetical protein